MPGAPSSILAPSSAWGPLLNPSPDAWVCTDTVFAELIPESCTVYTY